MKWFFVVVVSLLFVVQGRETDISAPREQTAGISTACMSMAQTLFSCPSYVMMIPCLGMCCAPCLYCCIAPISCTLALCGFLMPMLDFVCYRLPVIVAKLLIQSVKALILMLEMCLKAPVICIKDIPVLLGGGPALVNAL